MLLPQPQGAPFHSDLGLQCHNSASDLAGSCIYNYTLSDSCYVMRKKKGDRVADCVVAHLEEMVYTLHEVLLLRNILTSLFFFYSWVPTCWVKTHVFTQALHLSTTLRKWLCSIIRFSLLHLFDKYSYQLLCKLHAASAKSSICNCNWKKKQQKNTDSDRKMIRKMYSSQFIHKSRYIVWLI